jgi:ketosteroid isomerase-like protein
MSQENAEIVRRVTDAFNRSWEPDFTLIDPDVVLDTTGAVFDRDIYRGHDGVRQWLANQREVWTSQRFEEDELIPVGEDRVLSSFRFVSVGRNGIETVAQFASLTTIHAGKVTHVQAFLSKAEALEAAGRSE